MYRINKVIFPLLFVIFSSSMAIAQAGYSPYTVRGIGDLNPIGLTQNVGMGGVGISNGGNLYYNNSNPALLPKNNLSVFAIGLNWEYKQVSTSDLSQENYGGGFNYALIGLPLIPNKWTLGVGLMPYSVVNYKYGVSEDMPGVPNATVAKAYEGTGGFNKFIISNGVKINKNFSVGLTLGYLFGSKKSEVRSALSTERTEGKVINGRDTVVTEIHTSTTSLATERLTIGGLYLMGGVLYSLPIKEKTNLNFGVTYELGGTKGAKLFKNLKNLNSPLPNFLGNDTISERSGDINLPSTLGIGVSYGKDYHWTVGADLLLRNWSSYNGFESESGAIEYDENFENNYKIAVGAEFTPDVSSIDSYLKRVTYRIGANYEKMPYNLNNTEINDFGINFGISLPVRNFSSFDVGFQLGKRGTTDNELIEEKYFQVFFGVTFNDRWFVRRKFD